MTAAILATSCGDVPQVGGRPNPPDFGDKGYPRALVAVQNASQNTSGVLQFIDVLHNNVSNQANTVHFYGVSGFSGQQPTTIQDYVGLQLAYVYGAGNGSFIPVNTNTDTSESATPNLPAASSSIYVSPDINYVYAANPTYNGGTLTVIRLSDAFQQKIPLPNIQKLAMSPGGTTVLAFQGNANNVWQLNYINNAQITTCGTQGQPSCVTQLSGTFDRPINAVYSADGAFAYIINCGPQCGGTTASISVFSTTPQNGVLPFLGNIPVPAGAYYAIQNGSMLYVAGMSKDAGTGLYRGFLTPIALNNTNFAASVVETPVSIGDGYYTRMKIADDNTLWVGANNCTLFYAASVGNPDGCVTMLTFDPSSFAITGTPMVMGAHGDVGGIAPIQQAGTLFVYGHEVYTTEGGNIYIYSTTDGSPIDASLAQVVGYAYDICFVDGLYNCVPN